MASLSGLVRNTRWLVVTGVPRLMVGVLCRRWTVLCAFATALGIVALVVEWNPYGASLPALDSLGPTLTTSASTTVTSRTTTTTAYGGGACATIPYTLTTMSPSTTSSRLPCWTYNPSYPLYLPELETDGVDSEDYLVEKRAADLRTRSGSKPIRMFGSCRLQESTGKSWSVNVPGYPSPEALEGASDSVWWYVPRHVHVEGYFCPVVVIARYSDQVSLTQGPVIPGNLVYLIGARDQAAAIPKVNVDHVYEIQTLKDFITNIIRDGLFPCHNFNTFFKEFDSEKHNSRDVTRLRRLLLALPSNENGNFGGLDDRINLFKGRMFSPKEQLQLDLDENSDGDTKMQRLSQMAVVIGYLGLDEVARLYSVTNARIYQTLQHIDGIIEGSSVSDAGRILYRPRLPPHGSWADVYSDYMVNLISTQNIKIARTMSSLVGDVTDAAMPEAIRNAAEVFNHQYPPASWTLDANKLLSWPPRNGPRDVPTATPTREAASDVPTLLETAKPVVE